MHCAFCGFSQYFNALQIELNLQCIQMRSNALQKICNAFERIHNALQNFCNTFERIRNALQNFCNAFKQIQTDSNAECDLQRVANPFKRIRVDSNRGHPR